MYIVVLIHWVAKSSHHLIIIKSIVLFVKWRSVHLLRSSVSGSGIEFSEGEKDKRFKICMKLGINCANFCWAVTVLLCDGCYNNYFGETIWSIVVPVLHVRLDSEAEAEALRFVSSLGFLAFNSAWRLQPRGYGGMMDATNGLYCGKKWLYHHQRQQESLFPVL